MCARARTSRAGVRLHRVASADRGGGAAGRRAARDEERQGLLAHSRPARSQVLTPGRSEREPLGERYQFLILSSDDGIVILEAFSCQLSALSQTAEALSSQLPALSQMGIRAPLKAVS